MDSTTVVSVDFRGHRPARSHGVAARPGVVVPFRARHQPAELPLRIDPGRHGDRSRADHPAGRRSGPLPWRKPIEEGDVEVARRFAATRPLPEGLLREPAERLLQAALITALDALGPLSALAAVQLAWEFARAPTTPLRLGSPSWWAAGAVLVVAEDSGVLDRSPGRSRRALGMVIGVPEARAANAASILRRHLALRPGAMDVGRLVARVRDGGGSGGPELGTGA